MLQKMDLTHWLLVLGTPVATAFLHYLMTSKGPLDSSTLAHAGLASLMVALAVLKDVAQASTPSVIVPAPVAVATPAQPQAPAPGGPNASN